MVTEVLDSPPEPIQSFRYHCDSHFLTEPLENMLADSGLFGLVVLDRREANVGWLKGKRVEPVKSASSLVPGKQRKGGQSAQRFARLRLEAIDNFYQEVAGMANDLFVSRRHELDGILVGGPSPTKDEFLDGDYLHHELQDSVLGKFDVAYTDESGLYDIVDAASEVLAEREMLEDKQAMEQFFKELHDGNRATYGFEPTRENLIMGAVDQLPSSPRTCARTSSPTPARTVTTSARCSTGASRRPTTSARAVARPSPRTRPSARTPSTT